MRTPVMVGVWSYMVLAVVAEVATFYNVKGATVETALIALLAASQATAVAVFYMELKDEPGSLRLFALIPLMFLAALLIAMVASLG